ncbi:DUF2442 domain-containing protein [Litoribacter ruber]|uniref:DUF2442 domain-containing protein n=1 Tax=Litoribacter ruber TaxID=702568 RepID=UPI001BDA6529|nr:DUF2442 domain-containing protein [Litoribacter ruber]MBT0812266.1 DUF2442 domain-containing protein [Litoribacter ruber]
MHSVKEIIEIQDFTITLKFENDELRQKDLYDSIHRWGKEPGSKLSELKDPTVFKKANIDPELETLIWDNGLDLCLDVLFDMSEKMVEN